MWLYLTVTTFTWIVYSAFKGISLPNRVVPILQPGIRLSLSHFRVLEWILATVPDKNTHTPFTLPNRIAI